MITRIAMLLLGVMLARPADGWTPTRLLLTPTLTEAFRLSRPWTLTKNWCDVVKEPAWPFAYQKWEGSLWERKGRTNQDLQDMLNSLSNRELNEIGIKRHRNSRRRSSAPRATAASRSVRNSVSSRELKHTKRRRRS